MAVKLCYATFLRVNRVLVTEDDGESKSYQHCNDRRRRHQRDEQVKGRHISGPEQAFVWIHCELPQRPVQSAAEEQFPLPEEIQYQGNIGGPQVSSKTSSPSESVCLSLSSLSVVSIHL